MARVCTLQSLLTQQVGLDCQHSSRISVTHPLLLLKEALIALLNLTQVTLVLVLSKLRRSPNDIVGKVLVVAFMRNDNFVGLVFGWARQQKAWTRNLR